MATIEEKKSKIDETIEELNCFIHKMDELEIDISDNQLIFNIHDSLQVGLAALKELDKMGIKSEK